MVVDVCEHTAQVLEGRRLCGVDGHCEEQPGTSTNTVAWASPWLKAQNQIEYI